MTTKRETLGQICITYAVHNRAGAPDPFIHASSSAEEACTSAELCYNARSSSILMFPQQASERLCADGCLSRRTLRFTPSDQRSLTFRERGRPSGFTLLELLIVIGIIALLLVLLAPAFTSIKSGTDVTSAAYSVKGVLDTARTYAKANNTYTWVGFFEEDMSTTTPGTAGVGRLVMSIVASKDGTIIYAGSPGTIDPTRLIQVGKLTKIDNVHLATFTDGSGTGSTFDARPPVTFNGTQYRIGAPPLPPNTGTLFQYPAVSPYPFWKAFQFSPGGEARIINSATSYSLQTAAEIGLEPTHGAAAPASVPANAVAVQFTGVGGNVKIYRR